MDLCTHVHPCAHTHLMVMITRGLALRWNCSRCFCSLQIPKVMFTLWEWPSLVGVGFGLLDYQHCPWAMGAPVPIPPGSRPLSSWLTRGEHENAAPLHLRRRCGLWDVSYSLGTRRGVGLHSTLHPCLDFALATCLHLQAFSQPLTSKSSLQFLGTKVKINFFSC